ncbi:MAG: hypothetical protein JW957_04830 [Candidatus Omnitrophica bacterium]|nr:hypothetical protein [Candidatus Omnitrophota bacterium]
MDRDVKRENKTGILRAGAAKSDITVSGKSADIHDPLYAKALVLDDGVISVVIIGMDTTAIDGRRISKRMLDDVGDDFLSNLRRKVQSELQIPGRNVLVNASHTHPPCRHLCGDEEQVEKTFDAVRRAFENMAEVKIGSGIGYEDRITINRTLRLKNGKHWTIRNSNPCPPDEEVEGLGPLDAGIGIIRIDRTDGSPLAVVYNFACHPLTGVQGSRVSAYLPGFASKVIEDTLGNGVIALFLQGAGGDAVDILFKDINRPRTTEPLGTMLALSTLKAHGDIRTESGRGLNVITETIELPFRRDIPGLIESLKKEQSELLASLRGMTLNLKAFIPLYIRYGLNHDYPADYSYRYLHADSIGTDEFKLLDEENRGRLKKYLHNIDVMEKLTKIEDDIATLEKHQEIINDFGGDAVTTEVQGIKIGECVIITSAAELLTEVGLNIKKASPYKHTFISAFSNGYLHYGPPASYYGRGGYEVTECLLAPEWQEVYEKKANNIISQL